MHGHDHRVDVVPESGEQLLEQADVTHAKILDFAEMGCVQGKRLADAAEARRRTAENSLKVALDSAGDRQSLDWRRGRWRT